MFPVDGPDRLALEGAQEPQLQAEIGFLPVPNLGGIGETLRRSLHFPRHPCFTVGAGHMENRKTPLCLVLDLHPVVSAAISALIVDIIAVDRAVAGHLMAAAVAAEKGIVPVRRHHARPLAF